LNAAILIAEDSSSVVPLSVSHSVEPKIARTAVREINAKIPAFFFDATESSPTQLESVRANMCYAVLLLRRKTLK
jgi:hypothetical protein